jgi:CheY-like chemotaxis protein
VQQIEGRIEAGIHPDGGAVFDIWLPVESEAQSETVTEEKRDIEGSSSARTGLVLAVEDEEKMRKVIVEILELCGHQVITAGNGEEALELLQNSDAPDAILLDLKMPVMDGREFFRRLVDQQPLLADRVLFLTGDTLSPNAQNFLKSVGRPYLSKPFTLDELRGAVEKLISEE